MTYLVEGGEDVVGELYLGNGSVAHRRETYPKSSDTLLRQGRIEDTLTT